MDKNTNTTVLPKFGIAFIPTTTPIVIYLNFKMAELRDVSLYCLLCRALIVPCFHGSAPLPWG